jgi:signal peptidase II
MIDPQEQATSEERENTPSSFADTKYPSATPTEGKPGIFEIVLPLLIMAVVLLLDQGSKYLVETRIPLYGYWAPIPGLENIVRFTHTANTGAVFGLFQGTGMFFAGLAIVVAAAIVYINHTLPGKQWLLRVALGLQLGGALGNMIDRFRQGHVTDFIDIGPWYIFNVADMAIVGGVIVFAIALIRDEREARRKNAVPIKTLDTQERLDL